MTTGCFRLFDRAWATQIYEVTPAEFRALSDEEVAECYWTRGAAESALIAARQSAVRQAQMTLADMERRLTQAISYCAKEPL